MPGQQRAWRDQAVAAPAGWQQAGQRGQDRPVGPVWPGTGDLATQDRYLMTEHHDLGVLRRLAAAQQVQPAKDLDDGEVQKSNRHRPRSCLIAVSRPNSRSQPPRGVLEQYTHRSLHGAAPLKPLPEPLDLEQYRVRRHTRAGGLVNEYRLVA